MGGVCVNGSTPGHGRAASLSEQPDLEYPKNTDLATGGGDEDDEYKHMNSSASSQQNGSIKVTDRSHQYNNHNKAIKNYLQREKKNELKIKKCLLLGAGSSGKSTLFRQLKCIHGRGFDESEFLESQHVIRSNCVTGILILLKKSQELYDSDNNRYASCLIDLSNDNDENIESHIKNVLNYQSETFEEIDDLKDSELINLGQSINILWSLPQTQETFQNRQNFSLIENMDYFLNKIEIIFDPQYEPSQEDHLKCRTRTTGLIEATYMIKDVRFHIFDVGGQRNERKKWIQLFEGVTAVIFVAALNHFCAVLFEDENKNAMLESLQLFEEIANSKWFKKTEMILFLNKNDLFRQRLQQQLHLNLFFNKNKYICTDPEHYEEYEGPNYMPTGNEINDQKLLDEVHKESAKFIQRQYEKRNLNPYKRIFVHITTATDQENIQKVFWDVQNIVINSNLRKGGLV